MTALGVLGLGTVAVTLASGAVKGIPALASWLSEPAIVPRWAVGVLTAVILSLTFLVVRRPKTAPKSAPTPHTPGIVPPSYMKFWGVLWKARYGRLDGTLIFGPFCPDHLLEMEILGDKDIQFACWGEEHADPHFIPGPSQAELIPPPPAHKQLPVHRGASEARYSGASYGPVAEGRSVLAPLKHPPRAA